MIPLIFPHVPKKNLPNFPFRNPQGWTTAPKEPNKKNRFRLFMWATAATAQKNPALLSMKSWMVNRDPYVMAYYNPYISG